MGAANLYTAILTGPNAAVGVPTGETVTYLRTTGATNGYARVADHADLDITGDIFIAVRVALDSWTSVNSQTLLAKWGVSAGSCSYELEVRPTGELMLNHSTDGTATKSDISTVTLPSVGFVAGRTYWVGAQLDVDNGAAGRSVKFYYANDGDVMPCMENPWVQLGSTVTTAGTTSIFNSTQPVYIGTLTAGSIYTATGNFYAAVIKSGLNAEGSSSLVKLDIDFTTKSANSATPSSVFTEQTGKSVTVQSPATLVTADAGWRFCVETLIATRGSKWDLAKWDQAVWDDWSWYDLTPYLVDGVVSFSRGKDLGKGYPYADPGVCSFQLKNDNNFFSTWNDSIGTVTGAGGISTNYINREWQANSLVRVSFFKAGASTSSSFNTANGITTISRANWNPRFTGIVESWNEEVVQGNSVVTVTAVETLSALSRKTLPAGTLSAGDTLAVRLYKMLIGNTFTADAMAAGSDNWSFPIVDGSSGFNYFDNFWSLQARSTISGNLLQEAYLSALSVLGSRVETHRDGSLRMQYLQGLTVGTNTVSLTRGAPVVRFTSSSTQVPSDSANFGGRVIDAYFGDTVVLSENSDFVVNYFQYANVGGSTQTLSTSTSIGMYGKKADANSSLIGTVQTLVVADGSTSTDAQAWTTAYSLRTELDGWQVNNMTAVPFSQVLSPGKVTIQQQHAAQRNLDYGFLALFDWFGQPAASTLKYRCLGRVVKLDETIQYLAGGVMWTTTATFMPRFNYRPTS